MRVLIVKLSSIGDVVHTLPALYSLRKGLEKNGGKAEIDWLVEEPASPLLKGHPLIDNVITVKSRGWTRDLKGNMKALRFMAGRRYDMVLDFQGLMKSAVWVKLSKGRRKIGFSNSRELSPLFLTERLPPYDPDKHAVDRYLDLARYAGGSGGGAVFDLNITPEDKKKAEALLEKNGIVSGKTPFFVIVPAARWKTKLWDDEKFVEVARAVTKGGRMKAVLAGGPDDKERLEAMMDKIGSGAVNLSGSGGLKELAAIMRLASFAVTVDSGPMHIAAAAGAKTVALFGPTAPWRTGPYGKGHIIVRRGLKCSPCFKKQCADAKCMGEITVEDVLKAVKELKAGL